MGYQDYGESVGDQFLQDGEEVLGFLRCQDGSGFVEDQDAYIAVEGLQDLDPLAHPHGEVGHTRPRVHLQAVSLREFFCRPDSLLQVQGEALAGLRAEDDVLGHGERRYQGEVLMDHPDAASDGVFRVPDLDPLAVDEDLTLIRGVEAVEDLHQGGLARAVLAEDAEDFTAGAASARCRRWP